MKPFNWRQVNPEGTCSQGNLPAKGKKMLTVFTSFFLSWIPHLLPAVLLENGCAEYDLKFEQGREGVCVCRFHGEAVLAESP